MSLLSSEPPSKIPLRSSERNDYAFPETKDVAHNISSSRAQIIDNLSSPRVRITKESINTIFNTGIKVSFSNPDGKRFHFEALSGNLKVQRRNAVAQPKSAGRTVNLYKIGAALGGEAYLCIAAAKAACVKAGQTDRACEHPQKAVLQNCVDKAMGSADALVSDQLKADAG